MKKIISIIAFQFSLLFLLTGVTHAMTASSTGIWNGSPNFFYGFNGNWADIFNATSSGIAPVWLYCNSTTTITSLGVYDLVSRNDTVDLTPIPTAPGWYFGQAPGSGNPHAWNNPWAWQTGADICNGSTTFWTIPPPPIGADSCDIPTPISISSPSNGANVVNNFSNWTISTPHLLEGCSYKIVVDYQPQIGSIVGGEDVTSISVTPDFNPTSINIPKPKNIWNFYNATTTAVNVLVNILDSTNQIGLDIETSTFNIVFSATSSPATTPFGFNSTLPCGGVCTNFGTLGSGLTIGSIGTATTTLAVAGSHCSPAADWTDIGGGLSYAFCSTINWLFVPNDTTQGILAGDMNALQTVPPFSWFFATNQAIMSAATNVDHLTPNLGVTYEVAGSSVIATTSVTIIPADMASIAFAGNSKWAEFMNVWFNFVLTAMIVLCIIMLYKIAL